MKGVTLLTKDSADRIGLKNVVYLTLLSSVEKQPTSEGYSLISTVESETKLAVLLRGCASLDEIKGAIADLIADGVVEQTKTREFLMGRILEDGSKVLVSPADEVSDADKYLLFYENQAKLLEDMKRKMGRSSEVVRTSLDKVREWLYKPGSLTLGDFIKVWESCVYLAYMYPAPELSAKEVGMLKSVYTRYQKAVAIKMVLRYLTVASTPGVSGFYFKLDSLYKEVVGKSKTARVAHAAIKGSEDFG